MSACVELRRARPLLGTVVEIAAAAPDRGDGDAAIDAAFAAVERVQRLMSAHDPASEVSRLNRGEPVDLDPWTARVLAAADEFRRVSGGMFDVGVGLHLRALGVLPAPAGRIDLGGIAKGFAVDRAVEALRAAGIARGVVNAGGDLAVFGDTPHAVALRDPRRPGVLLGRIAMRDSALASSAAAYPGAAPSVIVRPGDGGRAAAALGASVLAANAMTADALTKLVMLQGRAAAPVLAHFGAGALFVAPDGQVHATADWPEALADAA